MTANTYLADVMQVLRDLLDQVLHAKLPGNLVPVLVPVHVGQRHEPAPVLHVVLNLTTQQRVCTTL